MPLKLTARNRKTPILISFENPHTKGLKTLVPFTTLSRLSQFLYYMQHPFLFDVIYLISDFMGQDSLMVTNLHYRANIQMLQLTVDRQIFLSFICSTLFPQK